MDVVRTLAQAEPNGETAGSGPARCEPSGIGTLETQEIPSELRTDRGSSSSSQPQPQPTPDAELRGKVLGRYVVLSKLGMGAMGLVLAAYDPQLDRKVALKLLKSRSGDRSAAQLRLQREAQALARLDHRNVVRVYDVGVHFDQLFVAMEFVEGQTLGEWMIANDGPRPWREVLPMFMAAGRGLAAAHGVGLVHRDFKPDNVMVGDDGHVRVMDFGLARYDPESASASASASASTSASFRDAPRPEQPLGLELTHAGSILGTPAYMPLEQLDGRPADERSDQFSFCVALYEVLYGERPYRANDMAELLRAVEGGQIEPAPKGVDVPTWLREVVVRGLAPDADDRWPSMQDLLDALADDPAIRRRKWGIGAAIVGLLSGAVTLGWALAPAPAQLPALERCDDFVSQLDAHWGPERSRELAGVVAQLDAASASYVGAELERLTTNWRTAARSNCNDTYAPAPDSRARQCLEAWLLGLDRVAGSLAEADAERLRKAPDLLARLEPVAGDYCTIVPDPDVDPGVAELAARAREGAALGDFEAGRAAADEALADARALADAGPYSVELAEAHDALGFVLAFAGDFDAALPELQAAWAHARSTAYHRLDLDTLLLRVKVTAIVGATEVAATLLEQAEPLAQLMRLADGDPRRGEIHEAWGRLERARGDYEAAIEHHRSSRALFLAAERPLSAAKATQNIGACQQEAEHYDRARERYEDAREMFEAAGVSPTYRNRVKLELDLGMLAAATGDLDGLAHFDAVARHGTPGDRVEALTWALALEYEAGSREQAPARAERALAAFEAFPDTSPELAVLLFSLAGVAIGRAEPERGEALLLTAERHASTQGLGQRFMVQQTIIHWLYDKGRCEQREARLLGLDALIAEPGADELEISGWREAERAKSCEPSPRHDTNNRESE